MANKEIPKRLAPTIKTLRALFAKSGNRCAFPNCDHPLIDEDQNFIAQICHIEDALPGGRFNEKISNEETRLYDNLILFCYRHHVQTNNIQKFPVRRLHEIKSKHEAAFAENFEVNEKALINIFNNLKSIKDDTSTIINTQQLQNNTLDEIKALLISKDQKEEIPKSNYTDEINSILKLRDSNNHNAALKLLSDFQDNKWGKLSTIEKYKLIANIGICHLDLNNIEEAANCFIEAFNYNQHDAKASGFAALGYSIIGKTNEAREKIKQTILKDPHNSNAYVALVKIEGKDIEFSELLQKIPLEIRDTVEVSYAIGGLARYKKDFEAAIYWFQNALDVAKKNESDLKATLVSTILESVTNPSQIMTGQIDNKTKNKINYCIELLSESWGEIKDSDLRKSRSWILINRGIAKKLLGDLEGAYEDIKQAELESENSYFAIRHLAIVSFELDKLDKSLDLLEQLKRIETEEDKEEFNIDIFKASVFFRKKDFKQSINTLKNVLNENLNEKTEANAKGNLISSLLAINNFDEAIRISYSLINEHPKFLRGYIEASKVFIKLKNNKKALEILDKSFNYLDETSSHTQLHELALQFSALKQYQKVIEILERITDPAIYTDLSRALLIAYYNAGEIGKALNLCESIRMGSSPIELITDIQSSIYESIGNLPKAIEVCEEYLGIYPDDQWIRIRLAIIYYRSKEKNKVKEILNSLNILGDLPIDIQHQLACLNVLVGELKRGLTIAFENRRNNYTNGNAHLKYIGLISEFSEISHQIGEIDVVDIDTAVKIKNENEEIITYYILNESERMSKEELLITDSFAQSLIGSKVGDLIEVYHDFGEPQRFKVVDILSKYVYAYQESIELLKNRFPDLKGFRVINTGKTGDVRKDLKPIFDSLDQMENFDNQLHKYYNQKLFTIGACSQLKGENPIKFWSVVIGNPELGIYSLSSVHTEFEVAGNLLDKETGIVIDIISLLMLASSKKLELLEVLPNKKVISRSSVECIDDLLREFEGISTDGYLIVGKEKGEYIKEHVTKKQIESNKKHYQRLLKWVEKNCEILPCNEALEMNVTQKEQLDKTLGKPFIDSILIAKENDYLFLAEEENLRAIAMQEFQVKGFSNYALLNYSFKSDIITLELFNEEVARLIGLGYKYLPVNSEILMKCAEKADYQPTFPFDVAIKTLDFSISSEDSSIEVSADFFYKLYVSISLPEIRLRLIIPVLQVLLKTNNPIIVLRKLLIQIEIKFSILQKQKDEIQSVIRDFIKSRLS